MFGVKCEGRHVDNSIIIITILRFYDGVVITGITIVTVWQRGPSSRAVAAAGETERKSGRACVTRRVFSVTILYVLVFYYHY